jgi:hypothetical protein
MSFGSLVFTPLVKKLQERYGSRRQFERMEKAGGENGYRTSIRDPCGSLRLELPQHIIPRYTVEEIRIGMQSVEKRVEALEHENQTLRKQLAELRTRFPGCGRTLEI